LPCKNNNQGNYYRSGIFILTSDLSGMLNVSCKTVSKIVNGRGAVTPDMALRLSVTFDTTPELWLNMQSNHDLWKVSHESADWKKVKRAGISETLSCCRFWV
jgi:addiction module antidote protein, HigA family